MSEESIEIQAPFPSVKDLRELAASYLRDGKWEPFSPQQQVATYFPWLIEWADKARDLLVLKIIEGDIDHGMAAELVDALPSGLTFNEEFNSDR